MSFSLLTLLSIGALSFVGEEVVVIVLRSIFAGCGGNDMLRIFSSCLRSTKEKSCFIRVTNCVLVSHPPTSGLVHEPLKIYLQLFFLIDLHLKHGIFFVRLIQHRFEARNAFTHYAICSFQVVVLLLEFANVVFQRISFRYEFYNVWLVNTSVTLMYSDSFLKSKIEQIMSHTFMLQAKNIRSYSQRFVFVPERLDHGIQVANLFLILNECGFELLFQLSRLICKILEFLLAIWLSVRWKWDHQKIMMMSSIHLSLIAYSCR